MDARVKAFIAAAGFAPDVPFDVFAFGDSVEMQNHLAALVLNGIKRATTSLLRSYGDNQESLPRSGDRFVVVDATGEPRCICRTRAVAIKRFIDVDERFAFDEGEGDRSLTFWRDGHRAFFQREGDRHGFVFSEQLEVVLVRFELVFVPVTEQAGGDVRA